MIEITMTGQCKNCRFADLYLDSVKAEDFFGEDMIIPSIHCNHEDVCSYFEAKIADRNEKDVLLAEEAYRRFKENQTSSSSGTAFPTLSIDKLYT